jgi:hypothetical protein
MAIVAYPRVAYTTFFCEAIIVVVTLCHRRLEREKATRAQEKQTKEPVGFVRADTYVLFNDDEWSVPVVATVPGTGGTACGKPTRELRPVPCIPGFGIVQLAYACYFTRKKANARARSN